jgi:hypothetical protein
VVAPRLNAAFYADSVAAFLRASDDEVYAPLASPHGYTLAPEQLSAWRLQLPVLRAALADLAARALAIRRPTRDFRPFPSRRHIPVVGVAHHYCDDLSGACRPECCRPATLLACGAQPQAYDRSTPPPSVDGRDVLAYM